MLNERLSRLLLFVASLSHAAVGGGDRDAQGQRHRRA
jgi:hypothetical protein